MDIYNSLKCMLENVEVTKNYEILPIEKCYKRVLFENIKAPFDMPKFDNSAMDGYGVKLCDIGKEVKLVSSEFAGDKNQAIKNGEVVKIMTGARVDSSVEAVVPFEYIEDRKNIVLPKSIKEKANIRLKGEEFEKDTILLFKGEELNNSKIALIASLGISHIKVYRKLKVQIISTGDEVQNHFDIPNPNKIFNSSSYYFLNENFCNVEFSGIVGDSKEEIKNIIDKSADLIVTTGGISMGEKDFTSSAFSESNYEIKFKKIDIKPGKPFVFCIGSNIATLLTGNPLASVLNYNIFVRPIIRKMAGCKKYYHKVRESTLQNGITRKAGRDEVISGNIDKIGFLPYSKKGSGMISVMAKSDGVIILDKSVWEKKKGEKVKYIDFRNFSEKFEEFISE